MKLITTLSQKRLLLLCGIMAPLVYVGSDIIAGISWEGYNFSSQAISELRGIGAPTRSFLLPILTFYTLFEIAFGIGIVLSAGQKRSIRFAGFFLILLGVLDLLGPFFAMDANKSVDSFVNVLHLVVTLATVIIILAIIAFGSVVAGRKFLIYSVVTIFLMTVMSVITFLEVPAIAAGNTPTLLGIRERIGVYSYMLWLAVFAVVIMQKNTK